MILSRLFMCLSCATLALGNGAVLLDQAPIAVGAYSSSVSSSVEDPTPVNGAYFRFISDDARTPSAVYNIVPGTNDNDLPIQVDTGESYFVSWATFLGGECVKYQLVYYADAVAADYLSFSPALGLYNYSASTGGLRVFNGFLLHHDSDVEFYAQHYQNNPQYALYPEYKWTQYTNNSGVYISYFLTSMYLQNWFNSGLAMYQAGFYEGLDNIRQSTHDDIYNEGYRDGYAVGLATPDEGATGIIDLFGAIANVPINILNGLGNLAVWHTPIVGIIVSFLLIGVICVVIKRFMA